MLYQIFVIKTHFRHNVTAFRYNFGFPFQNCHRQNKLLYNVILMIIEGLMRLVVSNLKLTGESRHMFIEFTIICPLCVYRSNTTLTQGVNQPVFLHNYIWLQLYHYINLKTADQVFLLVIHVPSYTCVQCCCWNTIEP